MSEAIKNLSWSERLAVIEGTNASDKQASAVFNVTEDEIKTARETVDPSPNFDVSPYTSYFSKSTTTKPAANDDTATSGTVVKKKRGNPGSKVKSAFNAVTKTPQPLEEFAEKHGVSINVLVQKRRFTTDSDNNVLPEFAGKEFKILKHNGVRSIWYEDASSN